MKRDRHPYLQDLCVRQEAQTRFDLQMRRRPASPLPRLNARRIGAVIAIVVFLGCYGYGLAAYGLLAAIGIGWLPSAALAWIAGRAGSHLAEWIFRLAAP